MKNWIARASAAAFAAGLAGTMACGSSSGCGGTNINDSNLTGAKPVSMGCGPGTVLSGTQCVPSVTCGSGTVLSGGHCVSTQ